MFECFPGYDLQADGRTCELVSRYEGCDTPDIKVGGHVIAACNVGANYAGTGAISYGSYSTFSEVQTGCAPGYHLPSASEWNEVIDFGIATGYWAANDGSAFSNYLKLPLVGGNSGANAGSFGMYHSSSSSYLNFSSSIISVPSGTPDRFQARCFRDVQPVDLRVEYSPATATTGIVQAKITTNRPLNIVGERIGWRQIGSLEYVKDYAENVSGEVVRFDDGYGMTGEVTIMIDRIYNDPNAFVTKWETVHIGEDIIIPVTGAAYNVYIAR